VCGYGLGLGAGRGYGRGWVEGSGGVGGYREGMGSLRVGEGGWAEETSRNRVKYRSSLRKPELSSCLS